MTVAVTGAFGHVGVNLVHALVAAGREVRVVDLGRPADDLPPGVTWVRADVRDEDAMRASLEGATTVFHLAAVISVAGAMHGLVESVNVGGVRATARAALTAGVRRFVHCSSVHAYDLGACRGNVVDEHAPAAIEPRLPAYDRSKAAGEAALREVVGDGLRAIILNPTGIIGPVDAGPSRMGTVLRAASEGRLPATITGSFDWVDVRDVVAALLRAEHCDEVGENFLVGGRSASVTELAEIAAGVTGVRRPLAELPMWFARTWSPLSTAIARRRPSPLLYTADTLHALASAPVVDHSKATDVLGHAPRPLERTVSDLVEWMLAGAGEPAQAR